MRQFTILIKREYHIAAENFLEDNTLRETLRDSFVCANGMSILKLVLTKIFSMYKLLSQALELFAQIFFVAEST